MSFETGCYTICNFISCVSRCNGIRITLNCCKTRLILRGYFVRMKLNFRTSASADKVY